MPAKSSAAVLIFGEATILRTHILLHLAPDTPLQGLVDTFMTVWNSSKPVIAAVNGYALGGGCKLVQVCDVKIASDKAVMGEPSIRAG